MTVSAWIFMLSTWGVTLGCTLYCFKKLLTSDKALGGGDDSRQA